jgi:hypothetical protein
MSRPWSWCHRITQGENSNLGNHHSPLYQVHVGIYPGYGFYNNSVWIFLHLLEPNGICILMAERQSTYMYTVLFSNKHNMLYRTLMSCTVCIVVAIIFSLSAVRTLLLLTTMMLSGLRIFSGTPDQLLQLGSSSIAVYTTSSLNYGEWQARC